MIHVKKQKWQVCMWCGKKIKRYYYIKKYDKRCCYRCYTMLKKEEDIIYYLKPNGKLKCQIKKYDMIKKIGNNKEIKIGTVYKIEESI